MVCVMPVKKLSVGISLFVFCYLSIGWFTPANAHPHMWVDLKSRIVLHDDASPSAINQEWLFDDFFSTALIEEAGLHPDGFEAGLQQEITEIMTNLQPYDYFTLVKRNGEPVPLTWIGTANAEIRGNRIWMGFTVAIDSPYRSVNAEIFLCHF